MAVEKRPFRPEDRARFLCPGDPQISPDATRVAFVLQRTDTNNDRMATDIYLVHSTGGEPIQLTNSGSDRSPRWSPDSRMLAFISERSGKPQIWLIDTTGGEAWCLPTEQTPLSAPVWAPDGKKIAFTAGVFSHDADWIPYPGAPEGDRKRAEEQAARNLHAESRSDGPKVSDVKVITRLRHRLDGVGYFGDRRSQVFIVEVPACRPSKPVGARQLTFGDFDHENPSWSPDGKRIVVTATRRADADYLVKSDLWSVDLETGKMEQLLDASGPSNLPVWSPDGTMVAYVGHGGRYQSSTGQAEVRVFKVGAEPAKEEEVVSLTASLDRPVNAIPSSDVRYAPMGIPPVWAKDGWVYFIITCEGDTYVYRAKPGTLPEKVAGSAGRVISSMTAAGSTIAYQSGSMTEPDQIFVTGPDGTKQLTSFNASLLRELAVCTAEKIQYKGADGWDINGWILKPYGYEEGKAYPTVLHIHGGPHGVYGPCFQFQGQLLASNGIAVLYTNPRGSHGFGQKFAAACIEDWGGKDFQDIMAGVDYVVSKGIADPERLGVTGWSYGGFMTCWTVTQTQRFKAAITGACVSNRHNFYGTSDIGYNFGEYHFGGTPWDNPEKLLERSAIHHIKNVTTPVLILHGEADLRCPVEQAEQFFIALKKLGKEAVLIRYPGEYHTFKKPSHWADRYSRVLSWFEHYLKK